MPTYDYKCEKCERTFEYFQSMSDDPLTVCQDCNGSLKRLIGGGLGIIFKGSGFYVTDNKSKNGNISSSNGNTSEKTVKTDSAPAKKTETKKETVKTT
ncbi:MAG: zinc ribbon domain-containing protein [Spirochaetales bacterium]|nr:zinc ribbon domain-containing protein [Spirochaetales bacterium]